MAVPYVFRRKMVDIQNFEPLIRIYGTPVDDEEEDTAPLKNEELPF